MEKRIEEAHIHGHTPACKHTQCRQVFVAIIFFYIWYSWISWCTDQESHGKSWRTYSLLFFFYSHSFFWKRWWLRWWKDCVTNHVDWKCVISSIECIVHIHPRMTHENRIVENEWSKALQNTWSLRYTSAIQWNIHFNPMPSQCAVVIGFTW